MSARVLAWLEETTMNPDKIPMSPAVLKFKARLKAEGRTEGKREALLVLLRSRGYSATEDERATIERCTDPATLDAWIVKAVTAGSVQAVLTARPPAKRRAAAAKRPAPRA